MQASIRDGPAVLKASREVCLCVSHKCGQLPLFRTPNNRPGHPATSAIATDSKHRVATFRDYTSKAGNEATAQNTQNPAGWLKLMRAVKMSAAVSQKHERRRSITTVPRSLLCSPSPKHPPQSISGENVWCESGNRFLYSRAAEAKSATIYYSWKARWSIPSQT